MTAIMIRKMFDNHENKLSIGPSMYISLLDQFVLKTFNQLFYI